MFWGFVSSHAVGERLWEYAYWVFITPLLVRLASVSLRRVVSISCGTYAAVVLLGGDWVFDVSVSFAVMG
jgi:hypothetical protein